MGGYIGARAGSLSTTTVANVQDVTATDTTPEVTIINNTHEDTDGGREGKVIFKGQQSGGEESTLAEIQGSHDGTADDQKGDLIFKTNDGSDGASPTEAMRIDSGQNVGIGIIPTKKLSVFGTGSGNATVLIEGEGGADPYINFLANNAQHWSMGIDDSDSDKFKISEHSALGTNDYFTVDTSGNVGIGTSSPTFSSGSGVQLKGSAFTSFRATSGSNTGVDFSQFTNGKGYVYNRDNADLIFGTNNANRMVIDNVGNVYVGGTDTAANSSEVNGSLVVRPTLTGSAQTLMQMLNNLNTTGTGGKSYIDFYNGSGTQIGSISGSSSAITYATSSDYRLKENVTNISDGITRVKQLTPKRFNFISDANTTVDGFIAHEAATVVPEAVSGEKDAMTEEVLYVDGDEIPDGKKVGDVKTASTIDPQGIDQSKLVPLLTAALQEAIAKIETLETKVAALEG